MLRRRRRRSVFVAPCLFMSAAADEGLIGAAQLAGHFDLELLRAAAPMLVRLS